VNQLILDAINPVRTDTWSSLHWAIRGARWELTYGFCRTRFERVIYWVGTSIGRPSCGTRNRLPYPPRWTPR